MDFTALSLQERLFFEHVHPLYQEVHHTAMTASDGSVLAQAETAVVIAGRKFSKELLETTLKDRIEIAEQERPACPVCTAVIPSVPDGKSYSPVARGVICKHRNT